MKSPDVYPKLLEVLETLAHCCLDTAAERETVATTLAATINLICVREVREAYDSGYIEGTIRAIATVASNS